MLMLTHSSHPVINALYISLNRPEATYDNHISNTKILG